MSERLCAANELDVGEARRFEVEGHEIALIRVGDEFRAIDDTCSHADYALSEGEVDLDDCTIECWKHGSLFSLDTGDALTLPATRPVATYDVKVADGDVYVEVPGG